MFVPQGSHGSSRFEGGGGDRLADCLESMIGMACVFEHPVSANEFHARLFLCSFDPRNQNRANFPGHPHMRSTAGGPIVTGNIDHSNVSGPLAWLP